LEPETYGLQSWPPGSEVALRQQCIVILEERYSCGGRVALKKHVVVPLHLQALNRLRLSENKQGASDLKTSLTFFLR
jgi:hypothetical protein